MCHMLFAVFTRRNNNARATLYEIVITLRTLYHYRRCNYSYIAPWNAVFNHFFVITCTSSAALSLLFPLGQEG